MKTKRITKLLSAVLSVLMIAGVAQAGAIQSFAVETESEVEAYSYNDDEYDYENYDDDQPYDDGTTIRIISESTAPIVCFFYDKDMERISYDPRLLVIGLQIEVTRPDGTQYIVDGLSDDEEQDEYTGYIYADYDEVEALYESDAQEPTDITYYYHYFQGYFDDDNNEYTEDEYYDDETDTISSRYGEISFTQKVSVSTLTPTAVTLISNPTNPIYYTNDPNTYYVESNLYTGLNFAVSYEEIPYQLTFWGTLDGNFGQTLSAKYGDTDITQLTEFNDTMPVTYYFKQFGVELPITTTNVKFVTLKHTTSVEVVSVPSKVFTDSTESLATQYDIDFETGDFITTPSALAGAKFRLTRKDGSSVILDMSDYAEYCYDSYPFTESKIYVNAEQFYLDNDVYTGMIYFVNHNDYTVDIIITEYNPDDESDDTDVVVATATFELKHLKAGESLIGNVTLDGIISIKDATAVQKNAVGIISFNESEEAVADTNGDGYIDVRDATAIQKYLVGLTQEDSCVGEVYK